MERMVEALDPDAGIEDAYHPRKELGYGFKGLRIAARERIAPLSRLTGTSFEHYCLAALGRELPADAFPTAVVAVASPVPAPVAVEATAVTVAESQAAAESQTAEMADKGAPETDEPAKAADDDADDAPAAKHNDDDEAAAEEDDDDAVLAPLSDEPPSKRQRTEEEEEDV